MTFKASEYQEDIFRYISDANGNAVIEAVAGSGKTTTLLEAFKCIPLGSRACFVAFNKHITESLKTKAPSNVEVLTLHQLGLRVIKSRGSVIVDKDKLAKLFDATCKQLGYSKGTMYALKYPLCKTIGYLKNTCQLPDPENILNVTDRYNVPVPTPVFSDIAYEQIMRSVKEKIALDRVLDDYDLGRYMECIRERRNPIKESDYYKLISGIFYASVNDLRTVDFDDMVYLPIHYNMQMAGYDIIFADECQDLNVPQTRLLLNSVKKNGRIIAVGDRHQSIYGFRGADVNSIPYLIEQLNAQVLPLSITYRCPVSHVRLAQEIVPAIEHADNAIPGEIITIRDSYLGKYVQSGDLVLCRYTAPLIKTGIRLIASGKKARVRGMDLRANIKALIKKFDCESTADLRTKAGKWYNTMMEKCKETKEDLRPYTDKYEIVMTFTGKLPYKRTQEILDYVDRIFAPNDHADVDGSDEIVLSTVHGAKGLEANRVFILYPNTMPHRYPEQQNWEYAQEMNIKYVALTRAKQTLFMVRKDGE